MADPQSHITTDHDTIRQWAEARGGEPAAVKKTHQGTDAGILRILFSDEARDSLEPVPWDTFFTTFEDRRLAFLYQEDTKGEGGPSRFHKFVDRD